SSTGTLVNDCYIPWNYGTCTGSNPGIKVGDGMTIDANNNLYITDVLSTAPRLLKFAAVSGQVASGNVSPAWTIAGGTSGGDKFILRDVVVDGSNVYWIEASFANDGRTYIKCKTTANAACASPWNTQLQIASGCDSLGLTYDSTYLYVACGCDSSQYIPGGNVSDCSALSHKVITYRKSDKAEMTAMTFGGTPGDGTDSFSVPHGEGVNSAGTYLYVAESANNRIKKLSLPLGSGSYAGHIQDQYSAPTPTSIDMDDDGNVYVALATSGLIKKFDADGNLICTLGGYGTEVGKFTRLYGLAVSDDGYYLWASDVQNDKVSRFVFTNKDTCEGSWSDFDGSPTGNMFNGPRGIAVQPGVAGASAYVYVVHDQAEKIYKFNPDGTQVTGYSCSAGTEPRNITMDIQGYFYITLKDGSIVKAAASDCSSRVTFAPATTKIMRGGGIAVDDFGNLYAADRGDCDSTYAGGGGNKDGDMGTCNTPPTKGMTVHRLANYVGYDQTSGTPTASQTIKWQTHFMGVCDPALASCTPPGSSNGSLNAPWGVAVSGDGRYVWVADYGNNRIQKFNIGYTGEVTDQITIGSSSAPPNVSVVSTSPASPVP
ncbi:MAG TPA: SMP-30/gluconolactonase/LRE family protein, partial [bacterium]|nr:SMP-30/gluconolactonase/LRE family protein [bacterium]